MDYRTASSYSTIFLFPVPCRFVLHQLLEKFFTGKLSTGKIVSWQSLPGKMATLSHGILTTGKVLSGNFVTLKRATWQVNTWQSDTGNSPLQANYNIVSSLLFMITYSFVWITWCLSIVMTMVRKTLAASATWHVDSETGIRFDIVLLELIILIV